MARLAQMTYPTRTLTDSIGVTERIAKEFGGRINTSGLAKALMMAEKGGGFIKRVAALKGYGLVEGRGMLRVTPLAERIIFPHAESEGEEARREAFLGVELFHKLFERTQGRVPDEESFSIFLQDVTGANRVEVAKRSITIRRLFADGVQFARVAGEAGEQPLDEPEEGEERPRAAARAVAKTSSHRTIELLAGEYELSLPRTAQSIDVIISVLQMMKKELSAESAQAAKATE